MAVEQMLEKVSLFVKIMQIQGIAKLIFRYATLLNLFHCKLEPV